MFIDREPNFPQSLAAAEVGHKGDAVGCNPLAPEGFFHIDFAEEQAVPVAADAGLLCADDGGKMIRPDGLCQSGQLVHLFGKDFNHLDNRHGMFLLFLGFLGSIIRAFPNGRKKAPGICRGP